MAAPEVTLVNGSSSPPPIALPYISPELTPSDPDSIASAWLTRLSALFAAPGPSSAGEALAGVLSSAPAAWWKDHLALTWSLRCLHGLPAIGELLATVGAARKPAAFELRKATWTRLAPTLGWIQVEFAFSTAQATCEGVANLIPTPGEEGEEEGWKAWIVFTQMDQLKGHEQDVARLDVPDPEGVSAEKWDVLVVGAGQTGLQVASNLRAMGVRVLVVERGPKVGDHWKRVYEAFKLHLSKYYCSLSFRPWPKSTPFYPKIADIASFLYDYAESTHLPVLCSTEVQHASYISDAGKEGWDVTLKVDGKERKVWAGQVVLSTGLTGWTPAVPFVADKEVFKGTAQHSLEYRSSTTYKDKHALVVGVGSSGHDIAHDLYDHGAKSVTLIQRNPTMVLSEQAFTKMTNRLYNENGPPLEYADRLGEVIPQPVSKLMMASAPVDPAFQEQNDGLEKAGFRLAVPDLQYVIFERGGGHYLDVGTSQLVVDGRIKVKSGVPMKRFLPDGVEFEDGQVLPADLVVFATGYSIHSIDDLLHQILDPDVVKVLKPVWGLDKEGHVKGVFRDSGHPRLWVAAGTFSFVRYLSKLLALQILGTQLGVLTDRLEI